MSGKETGAEWKAFDLLAEEARRHPARVERMTYRTAGTTSVPARAEGEPAVRAEADPAAPAFSLAEMEERLRGAERSAAARLEEVRREGREALERARREAEEQAEAGRRAALEIGAALASFRAARDDYFAAVEQEVVKLALAIAARILNREASLDPLLLAGAVHVALGQLGETTGVRLRCPVEQVEGWRDRLRRLPSLPFEPEVVGDPALLAGDCRIEAHIGTVELGVRAQLEEIERGFFDLLEQRPGASARRTEGF
jgi:flagellar assembly protein FliH